MTPAVRPRLVPLGVDSVLAFLSLTANCLCPVAVVAGGDVLDY